MTAQWTAPDGTRVEVIELTGTGNRDGQWLKVTSPTPHFGGGRHFIGQVRTPGELAGLGIDLADFTETVTGSLN